MAEAIVLVPTGNKGEKQLSSDHSFSSNMEEVRNIAILKTQFQSQEETRGRKIAILRQQFQLLQGTRARSSYTEAIVLVPTGNKGERDSYHEATVLVATVNKGDIAFLRPLFQSLQGTKVREIVMAEATGLVPKGNKRHNRGHTLSPNRIRIHSDPIVFVGPTKFLKI